MGERKWGGEGRENQFDGKRGRDAAAWGCSPFVSHVSQGGRHGRRGTEDMFLVMEGKKEDVGGMCGWLRKVQLEIIWRLARKTSKDDSMSKKIDQVSMALRKTKQEKCKRRKQKGLWDLWVWKGQEKWEGRRKWCQLQGSKGQGEPTQKTTVGSAVGRKLWKASKCPSVGSCRGPQCSQQDSFSPWQSAIYWYTNSQPANSS